MSWVIIPKQENNNSYEFDNKKNIEWVFNSNVDKEIVLCVGKVQSGKTGKIFNCIDYALQELDYDIVILFAGTNSSLYEQTVSRLQEQKNDKYIYVSKSGLRTKRYVDNKKYVCSILKNSTDLENADAFIYSIRNIMNKKILIIDDESDYASVNISKNGFKSKTYEKIFSLYNQIYHGKLLQVTATPYANIISKKSHELKPNRVVCWTNSDQYCGINRFDQLRDSAYEIINATKNNDSNHNEYINKAVKYFISTIINNYDFLRNLKNYNGEQVPEITCLFNIDDEVDTHNLIYDYVNLDLKNLKNNRKQFYDEYIDKNISYDEFENLWDKIAKELGIIIFNKDGEWSNDQKKYFNIYVGGIKASRGFTFENLICELILNSPSKKISVDTLLQRCRWFGYRNDIIHLMKIYMNENIYQALIEAKEYVDLLEPGQHPLNKLENRIVELDMKTTYVNSTSKE